MNNLKAEYEYEHYGFSLDEFQSQCMFKQNKFYLITAYFDYYFSFSS